MVTEELRKTGIGNVGDIPWGTHFCNFYEAKEDPFDILIPYFKTGLENNEFCMWVIFPPHSEEETKEALRRTTPGLDQRLAAGDIEILEHKEWYLKGDTFDLQRVIDGWLEKLTQALSKGYAGMRANGSEGWLTKEDWKPFSAFEDKLNNLIGGQRIIVLCTYPFELVRAAELYDVARTHEFAIAKWRGQWEVLETSETRQAWIEMKRLNKELERRVVERTEQLEAANERLKAEIAERKNREKELERVSRALRLVSNSNSTLVHLTEEATVLSEICRVAVEIGGYKMAWVGIAEQDERKTVRPVAHAGFEAGYLESATITWGDEPHGRGPAGTTIRTGQPCVARNIPEDPAFEPWSNAAIKVGHLSSIALPLRSLGRTFGVLCIHAGEVDAFDEGETKVLLELANDLAFGLTILRTRAELNREEQALRTTTAQLRALTVKLESVKEKEGRRIARELHDEIGSAMTGLKWDLESLDKLCSEARGHLDCSTLRERINGMVKVIDTTSNTVQKISSELRPAILDDLGLIAAIEWQAQQFAARTGIICQFDPSMESIDLGRDKATAVFRIIQEALTNVLRHSQATRVNIIIEKESGELLVEIRDNGRGITEPEKAGPSSLGLIGMQERAHLLKGRIEITGFPGKGTVITLRVPV
jgi:signal transduction histidine kinase